MSFLPPLLHLVQSALSAYSLYLSTIIIPKLQQYEGVSERAAQYSNTAEHQLHRTRTTQTSGALAPLFSLCSALALLLSPATFPYWARLLLSLANFGATVFAYEHVRGFWEGKAKVPIVTDFNDSINLTNRMVLVLAALAGTWALSAMALFGPLLMEMGQAGGSHGEL